MIIESNNEISIFFLDMQQMNMMGGGAQKMPGQQQDFNKMFTAERGLPYLIRDKDLSFIIKKTLS